jgi:uncharacterized membrane protein
MQTQSRPQLEPGRDGGRSSAVLPWASVIGGSALALLGIRRRSLPGAALALAGGYLVYRGSTATRSSATIHVQKTFTINRTPEELFRFWRNLENLPQFMSHLEAVQVTGSRWSQWRARAPLGQTVSWHAEITDERENQYIVWQSLPGSDIENLGSVQFRPAPGDKGTEVSVAIAYRPPAGRAGAAIAKLFGESPEQQIREDLRHFKQLMEAGEIPTIEGQPSGRRSGVVRMVQAATRERRPTGTEAMHAW